VQPLDSKNKLGKKRPGRCGVYLNGSKRPDKRNTDKTIKLNLVNEPL
jgi:hypothetical protein